MSTTGETANGGSGLGQQDELVQRLLTLVHAHESSLSKMSTVSLAASNGLQSIQAKSQALKKGVYDYEENNSFLQLDSNLDNYTSTQSLVAQISLAVPEKVCPQHIVGNFLNTNSERFAVENEAIKCISALSYLCDEANELEEVSQSAFLPSILMFCPRPSSKIAEGDEISEERFDELVLCMGNSMQFFQVGLMLIDGRFRQSTHD